MNSAKKPVKKSLILPILISLIVITISVILIPTVFVELGLNYADRYTVSIAVISSFLIGYFTSELYSFLRSKGK